jgi:hypothetical protein
MNNISSCNMKKHKPNSIRITQPRGLCIMIMISHWYSRCAQRRKQLSSYAHNIDPNSLLRGNKLPTEGDNKLLLRQTDAEMHECEDKIQARNFRSVRKRWRSVMQFCFHKQEISGRSSSRRTILSLCAVGKRGRQIVLWVRLCFRM